MPTVILKNKWRLFFYSNEGSEPIHIHAEKGDAECKYWLLLKTSEIKPAYSFNLTPTERNQIELIIQQNFDIIVTAWNAHFNI